MFLLGLVYYALPVLLYEYAGRVVEFGLGSRNGALLVIGFSIIWGTALDAILTAAMAAGRTIWPPLVLALFLGTGVFFHNLNHDIFLDAEISARPFWRALVKRFPTLPEKASVLFDVRHPHNLYDEPYHNAYAHCLEFSLNILYAPSAAPADFRNYMAGSAMYWETTRDLERVFAHRHPGTGRMFTDSEAVIIIRYENGELLVNREILSKYPDVPYRELLDIDPPPLPDTPGIYPLRYKLKGYL